MKLVHLGTTVNLDAFFFIQMSPFLVNGLANVERSLMRSAVLGLTDLCDAYNLRCKASYNREEGMKARLRTMGIFALRTDTQGRGRCNRTQRGWHGLCGRRACPPLFLTSISLRKTRDKRLLLTFEIVVLYFL